MNKRFLTIAGLVIVVSFIRILTNYLANNGMTFLFNVVPVSAVALFAGANFKDKKYSFIVPLAAMLLTDCILNFIPGLTGFNNMMPYVYGTFVLITFIGFWLEKRQKVQN